MDIKEKALKTIKKYSLLQHGDSILIALSGGPDSVSLSVILDELKDNFNLSLHALYVNHGLRPEESREEEAFCRRFCDELGIKFHFETVKAKEYSETNRLNLQEAARELRYDAFEKTALKTGADRIALGHNADDQAETVVMRLIRGAGRKGLSGIPPVRGIIIRPLIDIERSEIEAFLSEKHISYMTDSSNLRKDYSRNRLRQEVIPLLQEYNPSLIATINRTADIMREEDEYLEIIVTKTLMRLISRKTDDDIELFLFPLENMEKPILRRVIRRAVNETRGLRGIDLIHIEDIIKLIKTGRAGDSVALPGKIRAVRKYSTLILTALAPLKLKPRVFDPPGELVLYEDGIVLKAEIAETWSNDYNGKDTSVFDLDRLVLPLEVRMRQKGDYFYPAGFGKKKKLQDFFVDEKVPRDERDSVPIVVSGGNIIWIAGYRMDERYRAKEGTKRFLIIKSFKR
ncbi:tRNA(Ile)-lysidine synthase [bacterium BMS3Abin10]|nr:tRNA(Ile)-lysidine synthase [bacterium BMS3Abin10]